MILQRNVRESVIKTLTRYNLHQFYNTAILHKKALENVRVHLTPVTYTSSTTQRFVRTLEFYTNSYIEFF